MKKKTGDLLTFNLLCLIHTYSRTFDQNGVIKSATETNAQELQKYFRNTDFVTTELSERLLK